MNVRQSYDALAEAYAARFFHELDEKPMDRALLDVLAAELRGKGRVVDLGCGPGFTRAFIEGSLESAGLAVESWLERRPYAAEHPSTRAYVLARRGPSP